SERDNSECPASVVVNLLLDVIRPMGVDPAHVVRTHPLQPFSAQYGAQGSARVSYAEEWLKPRTPESKPPVFAATLPGDQAPAADVIEVADLLAGLANPARRCRDALGIGRAENHSSIADDDPFVLAGLENWKGKQALLDHRGQNGGGDTLEATLAARGLLPPAEVGRQAYADRKAAIDTFSAAVRERVGEAPIEPQSLDLRLGPWRVRGRIEHFHADRGLIRLRPGKLR